MLNQKKRHVESRINGTTLRLSVDIKEEELLKVIDKLNKR